MEEVRVLQGRHIRLEPLEARHIEGLLAASQEDAGLYRWSLVPQGNSKIVAYVEAALAGKKAGTAVPFATVSTASGAVIGSTRFFNLERWAWPPGNPEHGRHAPDVCEIGYTWLSPKAIRTGANTEAKLLMLTHAFEAWRVQCVCFHTDMRNERSRAALERMGGRFEGVLRSHRLASDYIPRDSARYSVVLSDWPEVKARLQALLQRD
jgi:N-acetyltransferase